MVRQDRNQSIPLHILRPYEYNGNREVFETYMLGSEAFNMPCSAKYGSFSPRLSLFTYSVSEPVQGEAKQNSTISNESCMRSDPQFASMVLQKCRVSGMGSTVAIVRCSTLNNVGKVLRNKASDHIAPAPSDAMVRDRTRWIIRLILRNTVGKASLDHHSGKI